MFDAGVDGLQLGEGVLEGELHTNVAKFDVGVGFSYIDE